MRIQISGARLIDPANQLDQVCDIFIEGGKIAEACIYCENKDDESKLFRFNLLGDTGNANIA